MRNVFWSGFRLTGVLLAVSVLMAGCATTSADSSKPVVQTPVVGHEAAWTGLLKADGGSLIAYYDDVRRLHVLDTLTRQTVAPHHPQGTDRASSGIAAAILGDEVLVAFRDKDPARDLYVGGIKPNSELNGMGSETVPLARFDMKPLADRVAMIWYGEQGIPGVGTYQIYYREVDQTGKPLVPTLMLFEGIYPVMSVTPSGKVVAFTWEQKAGVDRILVRSKPSGGVFSDVTKVALTAPVTPFFRSVVSGERVFIFWHAQYGVLKNDFKLKGAYSDDGVKWHEFALPTFDGLDIETADIAADGTGALAFVAAAVDAGDHKEGKFRSYLVVSHDNGATWSDKSELRVDPLQAERPYSHTRRPRVTYLGPKRLLVAWEDWRSLRSSIHLSLSEDNGASWKVRDALLPMPAAARHERFQLTGDALFADVGALAIATEAYGTDAVDGKQIQVRRFTEVQLLAAAAEPAPVAPDLARLKPRVLAYWKAMAEKRYEESYRILDPYYRGKVDFKAYTEELGRLEYSDPEVDVVDSVGPIALVVSKLTVEVKPFVINRRTMKLDPARRDIPNRWLWMDGEWYLQYSQDGRGDPYTKY